jgi:hypothetical protein
MRRGDKRPIAGLGKGKPSKIIEFPSAHVGIEPADGRHTLKTNNYLAKSTKSLAQEAVFKHKFTRKPYNPRNYMNDDTPNPGHVSSEPIRYVNEYEIQEKEYEGYRLLSMKERSTGVIHKLNAKDVLKHVYDHLKLYKSPDYNAYESSIVEALSLTDPTIKEPHEMFLLYFKDFYGFDIESALTLTKYDFVDQNVKMLCAHIDDQNTKKRLIILPFQPTTNNASSDPRRYVNEYEIQEKKEYEGYKLLLMYEKSTRKIHKLNGVDVLKHVYDHLKLYKSPDNNAYDDSIIEALSRTDPTIKEPGEMFLLYFVDSYGFDIRTALTLTKYDFVHQNVQMLGSHIDKENFKKRILVRAIGPS